MCTTLISSASYALATPEALAQVGRTSRKSGRMPCAQPACGFSCMYHILLQRNTMYYKTCCAFWRLFWRPRWLRPAAPSSPRHDRTVSLMWSEALDQEKSTSTKIGHLHCPIIAAQASKCSSTHSMPHSCNAYKSHFAAGIHILLRSPSLDYGLVWLYMYGHVSYL